MDKMWAPWRSKYVALAGRDGCIFCEKPAKDSDRENYIVKRSGLSFAMLNIYPYNNGHVMVSPRRHVASVTELGDEELLDMMRLVRDMCGCLNKVLSPHGFNIGMNISRTAGAGFDAHVHMHVVPRWDGDTNFMPVVADTKVIPESLDALYERLKSVERD